MNTQQRAPFKQMTFEESLRWSWYFDSIHNQGEKMGADEQDDYFESDFDSD